LFVRLIAFHSYIHRHEAASFTYHHLDSSHLSTPCLRCYHQVRFLRHISAHRSFGCLAFSHDGDYLIAGEVLNACAVVPIQCINQILNGIVLFCTFDQAGPEPNTLIWKWDTLSSSSSSSSASSSPTSSSIAHSPLAEV
jgi:hypothetical protein